MTASLTVWWDVRDVGLLSLDRHGEMRFAYSEAWLADETAPPVSFSLPKRQQPFSRRKARPFFEGLLPEEEQREAIATALGISKGNEFRLLESLGGEVAGALTLWQTGEALPNTQDAKANTPLSEAELIALLDRLPKRPFLAGERGLRLSLAGAQSKLPVVLVDDQIALPAPGQPTTHILNRPSPASRARRKTKPLLCAWLPSLAWTLLPSKFVPSPAGHDASLKASIGLGGRPA